MSGSTTNYAIPYPVGGDAIVAALLQQLAERVDYLFTGWWGPVPQYVPKAGGTMSGNLLVVRDGAVASVILDSDPGQFAEFALLSNTKYRWVQRKSATAESGGNAGSDWELCRFDDNGNFLGVAMTVNRGDGSAYLYERLLIQPPSTSTLQAIAVIRDDVTKSVITGKKDTDAQQRISVHADGEISWGDGTNARDTFLSRVAANVLKVTGNLIRAGMNVVAVDTTITPDDYLNVLTGTTARTFTLPAIAGNTGVELVFKNRSTQNLTVQRAGANQIYDTAAVNSITVAAGGTARLINDGTYWLKV